MEEVSATGTVQEQMRTSLEAGVGMDITMTAIGKEEDMWRDQEGLTVYPLAHVLTANGNLTRNKGWLRSS